MSAVQKKIDKIAVIAGRGVLPQTVARAAQDNGADVFIAGLAGSYDPTMFSAFDHEEFALGQGGSMIKAFKARGVDTLVMIGGVNRPSLSEVKPDLWTAGQLAKIGLKAMGDNDLLSFIRDALAKEGFTLVGAHEIAPDLITPEGILGKHKPNKKHDIDIARGIEVAQSLGLLDVGQSVIIQDGIVIGVEAIEGTDALIERCAPIRRKAQGGVLVKLCKPQQDKRLDMPTIGRETIQKLAEFGYDGAAIHAGQSLMTARADMIEMANQNKLFIKGITPE